MEEDEFANDDDRDVRGQRDEQPENNSGFRWLAQIYNKLVFYGLDEQVVSSRRSRPRPTSYGKSPFFTKSESIGQKIIEEEGNENTQTSGFRPNSASEAPSSSSRPANRRAPQRPTARPRLEQRSPEDVVQSFMNKIDDLSEDLQVLDVTIADLELRGEDATELVARRERLASAIESAQIEYVNYLDAMQVDSG